MEYGSGDSRQIAKALDSKRVFEGQLYLSFPQAELGDGIETGGSVNHVSRADAQVAQEAREKLEPDISVYADVVAIERV